MCSSERAERAGNQSENPGKLPRVTERETLRGIHEFANFLRTERALYRPMGSPLRAATNDTMSRYFPKEMLDNIRILELTEQRMEDPPLFAEARALGFGGLPDLRHITSMTFLDVIVFNEEPSQRSLFHGLVQAAQVHVLGVDWYSELFVRGFVERGSHSSVPLEAQVFQLESRFMAAPKASFSVVEIVREAALNGRY